MATAAKRPRAGGLTVVSRPASMRVGEASVVAKGAWHAQDSLAIGAPSPLFQHQLLTPTVSGTADHARTLHTEPAHRTSPRGRHQARLNGMTGGKGHYTIELSHYEAVPPTIQAQLTSQYKVKDED